MPLRRSRTSHRRASLVPGNLNITHRRRVRGKVRPSGGYQSAQAPQGEDAQPAATPASLRSFALTDATSKDGRPAAVAGVCANNRGRLLMKAIAIADSRKSGLLRVCAKFAIRQRSISNNNLPRRVGTRKLQYDAEPRRQTGQHSPQLAIHPAQIISSDPSTIGSATSSGAS